MVELGPINNHDELKQLHSLIVRHQQYTDSAVARRILDKWDDNVKKFVKVLPTEYRMVLERQHLNMNSDLARLAAV
jgi:glutamate synthase domain-containing protein 3